jgi:hypothetical protein
LDKGTGRTAAIVIKKAAPGTKTSKASVRSETKKVRDADIAAKVATSAAAKDAAGITTAKTRAAQRDHSISKRKKTAQVDIAAKVATSAATKDAARITTAKTSAAQRDHSISKRKKAAQVQAVYTAAYAALVAVPGVVVKSTPGIDRHSRWAVVSTLW